MTKITYRRLRTLTGVIAVENHNRAVTSFSESLAYHAFLKGCLQLRGEGIDLEVYDEDGILIVGDFNAKDREVVTGSPTGSFGKPLPHLVKDAKGSRNA